MKFSRLLNGNRGLLLVLCILVSACNEEEYFPVEGFVTGEDAFCSQATDLHICQQLVDRCQPAFEYSESDFEEPIFSACVANPAVYPPADDGSATDGSTTDGSATDGSTTDGSATDGSTTDGSATDSSASDGSDPRPTLQEAYDARCEIDSQYLWIKHEMKKRKIINTIKKVKVCHYTGNMSAHTIVIACPALKAHLKHGVEGDYIGACIQ